MRSDSNRGCHSRQLIHSRSLTWNPKNDGRRYRRSQRLKKGGHPLANLRHISTHTSTRHYVQCNAITNSSLQFIVVVFYLLNLAFIVLKTVVGKLTGGSNPSLSANFDTELTPNRKRNSMPTSPDCTPQACSRASGPVETISKPQTWSHCPLSCSEAHAGEGGERVNLNLRREATPRNEIVWCRIW